MHYVRSIKRGRQGLRTRSLGASRAAPASSGREHLRMATPTACRTAASSDGTCCSPTRRGRRPRRGVEGREAPVQTRTPFCSLRPGEGCGRRISLGWEDQGLLPRLLLEAPSSARPSSLGGVAAEASARAPPRPCEAAAGRRPPRAATRERAAHLRYTRQRAAAVQSRRRGAAARSGV